ncbi:serine carboxypeptidase-like 13 isoform X2 [Vigna umbellata]|uniref:serine carboxypeptidase-like 13 isoform X2 n=2 Tax=Vigna umbellata TaxID=87088 RepID=UPI001F5FB84B|nr:serine carboxypeptidase-like 13 isoform X2 [Vigna umbellata]
MGKLKSSVISSNLVDRGILLFLLLLSYYSIEPASCASRVKFLPGFEGPLPFVLETGYVGVGESEDVQTFYYFIESDNNPKEDPLLLWLSGGPGCSGLSALFLEIGGVQWRSTQLDLQESIMEQDLPVFTGFTYATTELAAQTSGTLLARQAHQFLRKWLIGHPKFVSNEVYIAGDSYSGIPVPAIVQEIAQGNEKGFPRINIQGYLLGNPMTTRRDGNYAIPFAHGMALISDELFESLQKNCKGNYVDVDSENVLCYKDMDSFHKLVSGLSHYNILEPLCEFDHSTPPLRRSLIEKFPGKHFLKTDLKLPDVTCPTYTSFLSAYWANDDNVRTALNVRKGSIGTWIRCNHDEGFKSDISSSIEYHANLSRKGYRSLIYSGDHDMVVPFLGTQEWIRSLNYSIVDDWRPWNSNGQVGGYTRTYSNQMTFATVKGAGHTAPMYKSKECFDMFSRWISKRAL